jgi:hypothetical protein
VITDVVARPLEAPTTLARYRDYIHNDLSPTLGPIRLEELTHHHVANFVGAQLAAGRGPVTVHRCIAASRHCPVRSPTPCATTA